MFGFCTVWMCEVYVIMWVWIWWVLLWCGCIELVYNGTMRFIMVLCGFVYLFNVWGCVCVGFVLHGCVRLM